MFAPLQHKVSQPPDSRQAIAPGTGGLAAALNASAPVQRLRTRSAALNARAPLLRTVAQPKVVQRAREVSAVLDAVDRHRGDMAALSGSELRRIMYWNDTGVFDPPGGKLNAATLKKWRAKKIPIETQAVNEGGLPEFMRVRKEFGVALPACFGGAKIWFRKRPDRAMMQDDGGWISDNVYWRSAAGRRYMIHAILGFQGGAREAPNPHITLRNAATQVAIDLDITHPQVESRIRGAMEVTRSSFSRGLGGERQPGQNMAQDDAAFGDLRGDDVGAWLGALAAAAQAARE